MRFFPIFIFFLLVGCSSAEVRSLRRGDSKDLPSHAQIVGVPVIAQTENFCGPASLAMMLQWAGAKNVHMETLATQVYTPALQGTLQVDLLAAARRNEKFVVLLKSLNSMLKEVHEGHPVLVLQNLGLSWYPVWHYAVLTGYDLKENLVTLHSGLSEPSLLKLSTFDYTWRRGGSWALVILPLGELPSSATEREVIQASVDLEKVIGLGEKTVRIYRAILKRWPGNLESRIALANFYESTGERGRAIKELESAVNTHPQSSPAWHNLAILRFQNHQKVKALAAAAMAIRTAEEGRAQEVRQSLNESGVPISN
jgi:tetratricopeptide (TPR) repeat protein